jgi:dUTP pyrophosphatase
MSDFQQYTYQLNIKEPSDPELFKYYNNLSNHYNGDSGVDLFNNYELNVDPFKVGTIDFNINCEMINIETNTFASFYLVPRSSISNTSFQMANSIGIIDAGYRGNIKAKIRNFNPESVETLAPGKYFQIISPDLKPIKVVIVNELSETARGSHGFGSTNTK